MFFNLLGGLECFTLFMQMSQQEGFRCGGLWFGLSFAQQKENLRFHSKEVVAQNFVRVELSSLVEDSHVLDLRIMACEF